MSGISTITALEIFANPYDLEILIGQGKIGGKYAIVISRGPGHNFKMMLSSQPFAEKIEDALEVVEGILEAVQEIGTKEFSSGLLSGFLNPDGGEIDQSKVLNPSLATRIVEKLRQNQVASTYKMIAGAA